MRKVTRHIPVERLWELYDYSPFTGKLISRTTGKPVKGFPNKQGYLRMTVWYDGRPIQRPYSRVVWAWCAGTWPIHDVDHSKHDLLDNRYWSLRDIPSRANQQNRRNFAGAYWNKKARRWRAQISLAGKVTYLGSYDTREEASSAYWAAVERYGLPDIRQAQ